jgi:FKBP-type peptidyl-prolyl cis-trans isomerase SlyD
MLAPFAATEPDDQMTSATTVAKDKVVTFHYTIRDDKNDILETTRDAQPLAILYGHGNVLRGVEAALAGHSAGETVTVTLAPEDAYGERRDNWTQRVSKKYLPATPKLRPGMTVALHTEDGQRSVTVLKVGNKVVDVDLNHPFAGATLTFELELADVRDASAEELSHGHVHGPGGHHHD